MPLVIGLMNFVVPLQLGVRGRRLSGVELGQLLADRLGRAPDQTPLSLSATSHAPAGWATRRCPSSPFSPDVGVDYYLWSLQISGIGHFAQRCQFRHDDPQTARPGHDLFPDAGVLLDRAGLEPLDCRRIPDLTATFMMLLLDRYLGMHFFTNEAGGNQIDYVNLFWAWGHPSLHPDPAGLRGLF